MELSYYEILYLIILCAGIIGIPLNAYFKKNYTAIYSPMVFVCVIYAYYTIIGPLFAINSDTTYIRLVEHREYYALGLLASIVSFYSLYIGFTAYNKRYYAKLAAYNLKSIQKTGIKVIIVSIALFTLFSGGDIYSRINFLENSRTGQDFQGSFAAYLMLSINFLVVGVCMVMYNQVKHNRLILLFLVFALTASIFINEAFRYRLVILVVAIFVSYHLYLKKKPNLLHLTLIIIPFLLLMGVLEVARKYGRGIEVERLEGMEYEDLTEKSLNETDVFWASAYFMSEATDRYGFTYFDFVTNAIASPIPRKLWPGKPDGTYILQTNDLYGLYGKGQAYLNFCEYYLAFGWPGIIVISFLLGMFFKRMWLWYLANVDHPMAITAIAVFNGFIYVIISRNYLTQHLTLFMFTVYPAFFIIWLYKKRYLKS